MAMIRFSDEEVFGVDSQEYEILANAALAVKNTQGAIVEIGTRRGGSAKIIIDALASQNNTNRPMFCIDPYGNIDYVQTNHSLSIHNPGIVLEGDPSSKEITKLIKHDYDNIMRNRIIPSLYFYAYSKGLDFTFFCLEDTEFFARYSDGVPVYNEVKTLVNEYAFVFFDGPHDNKTVELETDFFLSRINLGSVFVYDDIWMYDHDATEKVLLDNGFEILEKKNIKASYIKIK
jgi:hypothetical protein